MAPTTKTSQPLQWPRTSAVAGPARLFADGRFFTPDAKARFVEVRVATEPLPAPGFPLTLNTGRVRDHWHTMTRTGKSTRLSQHCAEPFVEIHPHDAARHRVGDADLVRVSTGLGAILVRALVTPRQQPGSVFVPMHWNDQYASRARVDVLVGAVVDPISGQPASKNVPVRIERFVAATYGFAVLRRKPQNIPAAYWAIAKCSGGWRLEMAFADAPDDWTPLVGELVGADVQLAAYCDAETGRYRFACYEEDQLAGTIFLAPEPVAVSRDWAIAAARARQTWRQANARRLSPAGPEKAPSIAGRLSAPASASVPTKSPEPSSAVAGRCRPSAKRSQAGTNCGSCRAEIRNIIELQHARAPTSC